MFFQDLLERLKPLGILKVAAGAEIKSDGQKVKRFVQIGYKSGLNMPPTGPTHPFHPPDGYGDGDFDLDEEEVLAALRRFKIPPEKIGLGEN